MIRKKYVKRAYVEECICESCGMVMDPSHWDISITPAKYLYVCYNCGENAYTDERLGNIKYEYEDDKNE